MAFASYNAFLSALQNPNEVITNVKGGPSSGTASGQWLSQWTESPFPGAAPTTAVVPTSATQGCMGQQNATSGSRYLGKVMSAHGGSGLRRITWLLSDRLSHQGGLSGTAAGAQTTNLPTAALTRYTSGVGVVAGLEIYSAVGATPQTVTCSYTNQAGTAGQTSQPAVIGSTANSEFERMIIFNLQLGDTGVRSVESVTLSGSTGTVGNFGVVLYRPLVMYPEGVNDWTNLDAIEGLGCQMPEIISNACLWWITISESTTVGNTNQTLVFVDG